VFGDVFPIPTLPVESIRIRSTFFVKNCIGSPEVVFVVAMTRALASVVPKKLPVVPFQAVVPLLPVVSHPPGDCQLGIPPEIVKTWPAVPVLDQLRLLTAPPDENKSELAAGAAVGSV